MASVDGTCMAIGTDGRSVNGSSSPVSKAE